MSAGKMDRRITLQRASEGAKSLGHAAKTWSDIATVWAEWRAISDGERSRGELMAAGEPAARVTDRFVIRWSSVVAGLGPKDRLQYDGRTYDVLWTKKLGRRERIEISAQARAE